MGFSPTARLGMGEAGREIAAVAREIDANLVVVGHRPDGLLARWFSSVGTYLVKNLGCSVLIAQTEIGDEEFARLLTGSAAEVVEPAESDGVKWNPQRIRFTSPLPPKNKQG